MAKSPPASADFTEEQRATRLAYEGGLLRLRRDEVRLPDGGSAWREYVEHPGAVMMLAFVDDDTVLLERQFRYPKRRHFIELPAGKLEAGEPPLDTARRELVEECGFEAAQWLEEPASAMSLAMIPLREGGNTGAFGLLVLASPDATRYTADMGTEFLSRVGEIASAALSRLLPPKP